MKNWLKYIGLGLSALMISSYSSAQEDQAMITKGKIESLLGLSVSSIADAPVPGLFQAMTDRGLFYISNDGQFLIQGRVFNLDSGMRNETELALSQVRLDGMKGFSQSMIEYKAEDEKHAITVFTDITCGYCRKLHNEMEQLNDLGITVRYLAFPRAGLNSQNYDDMVSVWCADDQQTALTSAKNGDDVKDKSCVTEIAKHYEFGQQVGVSGTPAIVLEDGSMIPGYQPAAQLARILDQQTL